MRVLIVDDVSFVRNVLREILTSAGHKVVGEADTGLDAIDAYDRTRPDVVTLDLVMPKMGGIEACRRILRSDPSAKILIVSAMTQESIWMEAIHAGAKGFLPKPFKRDEFLRAIEAVENDSMAGIDPTTSAAG